MELTEEKFRKIRTIVLYAFFISMIILATLIIMFLKRSGSCELNPLVYGAQKAYDQGMEISCTCMPRDVMNYVPFYFNKEGVSMQDYESFSPFFSESES